MKYLELNREQQLLLLDEVRKKTNLLEVVVEKDEWVTAVILALFSLSYSEHLLFKGGTSLSKCWHIIERFSEDVDIALDRELLGFSEELSNNQIRNKLRKVSYTFIREKLAVDLAEQMKIQPLFHNALSLKNFACYRKNLPSRRNLCALIG
jgi:hypothetical protein